MKAYEIFPIIVIIILKFCIQFYYSFGDEFDPKTEYPPQIMKLLDDKFGENVAGIIRLYLPIFYDPKQYEQYLENAEMELQPLRNDQYLD